MGEGDEAVVGQPMCGIGEIDEVDVREALHEIT